MADLIIDTRTAVGAVGSCKVTIEPTDVDGTALAVFDGDGVQVRRLSSRTDSTGTLTLDVTPSSEVIGAGRYYTVTITDSDGGEWTFLIEKSTSTQTLLEALVVDPDELGLAVGLDNLVDGDTAVRTTDGRLTDARRPLPLGSRVIALGDSITLGTGSTLASGTSINGDSRQAPGSWFSRLCGQHHDRYYKVRNAGIGGDPVGGLGTLTEAVTAGATEITVAHTVGVKPYSTAIGFYVGGYPSGEGRFASSIVDNGDDTYTYTLTVATASAHAAGAEVGWGMHGRLQYDVIDNDPDTVPIMAGTNNAAAISGGTLTAAYVAAAIAELGSRLRTAGIEPVFLEVTPRSTYQAAVVELNDALAQECRTGAYHLVPVYRALADSDGTLLSDYDADGTHPNDLGHQVIADTVHGYLTSVPLRVTATPLAAYDSDPTNLIANACMLTGTAGSGGTVPTGAVCTPFVFAGSCVPGIEAPADGDGIVGQWATLTATGLNGNTALDFPVTAQTAGDLVYLAARVKTTGMSGGAKAIVQFLTGSFTIDLGYQVADNMDMVLMVTTSQLSAVSLSKLRVQLLGTGGSAGKLWIAQPLMRNLTTLGRAA